MEESMKYTQMSLGEVEKITNQFRNSEMFQNRNGSINGNWTQEQINEDQIKFNFREEKKFLFFNVEVTEEFIVDNEGNLLKSNKNFWARLLGSSSE